MKVILFYNENDTQRDPVPRAFSSVEALELWFAEQGVPFPLDDEDKHVRECLRRDGEQLIIGRTYWFATAEVDSKEES